LSPESPKLSNEFYRRNDVVEVSRDLLGKVLCSRIGGHTTTAVITETEAYAGETDRASHAFGGRRTSRTEPMYRGGGIAYVYLCYGIHHLFNVVVGEADQPLAVLIRAGHGCEGVDVMERRRAKPSRARAFLDGPGKLAQGLAIRTDMTGTDLLGDRIWIEDRGIAVSATDIVVRPRVGVDYAAEDAARPYRFRLDASFDVAGEPL